MNQKTAKFLRRTLRNNNPERILDHQAYRQGKKVLKAAAATKMSQGGAPHPFLPGVPSEGQASRFQGFRAKQPSYGPEIREKGAGRDRTREVKGPGFQLPHGLSPLMVSIFSQVGLLADWLDDAVGGEEISAA